MPAVPAMSDNRPTDQLLDRTMVFLNSFGGAYQGDVEAILKLIATAKVQTERAELAEQRLSEAHQEIGRLRGAPETGDDGRCWIKGCQRLKGHEGYCDPLPVKTSAERTPKDYAIEHAEYLAQAAESYIGKVDQYMELLGDDEPDDDQWQSRSAAMGDHRDALTTAVYEFRKRAERARTAPDVSGEPCCCFMDERTGAIISVTSAHGRREADRPSGDLGRGGRQDRNCARQRATRCERGSKAMNNAWEEWLQSEEGQDAIDGNTLELATQGNLYLMNRLWRAFQAGARSAQTKVTGP